MKIAHKIIREVRLLENAQLQKLDTFWIASPFSRVPNNNSDNGLDVGNISSYTHYYKSLEGICLERNQ